MHCYLYSPARIRTLIKYLAALLYAIYKYNIFTMYNYYRTKIIIYD
jgi:hypothetical protein